MQQCEMSEPMKDWLIRKLGGYTEWEMIEAVRETSAPYGRKEDGSQRTEVQASFGDGVCQSMHRKLEQYLMETRNL